jgi:hypothetical protein
MESFEKEQLMYEQLEMHIDNFCQENNITYCQILGILDMLKANYLKIFDDTLEIEDDE